MVMAQLVEAGDAIPSEGGWEVARKQVHEGGVDGILLEDGLETAEILVLEEKEPGGAAEVKLAAAAAALKARVPMDMASTVGAEEGVGAAAAVVAVVVVMAVVAVVVVVVAAAAALKASRVPMDMAPTVVAAAAALKASALTAMVSWAMRAAQVTAQMTMATLATDASAAAATATEPLAQEAWPMRLCKMYSTAHRRRTNKMRTCRAAAASPRSMARSSCQGAKQGPSSPHGARSNPPCRCRPRTCRPRARQPRTDGMRQPVVAP